MRATINGVEGGVLEILRGIDTTPIAIVYNDDGSPINLAAGDTVELVVYDYPDRSGTVRLDTTSFTRDSATVYGKVSMPLSESDTTNVTPGSYYGYIRLTIAASSKVYISNKHTMVTFR